MAKKKKKSKGKESRLADEENTAVAIPANTKEEEVENSQIEAAPEDVDLLKEEKVAKDGTEEAELPKAVSEEDDPIEIAKANAEAEDYDSGRVVADSSNDAVEKAEELRVDEVDEAPAATDVVEKVEETPMDELSEPSATSDMVETVEEAPEDGVGETPAANDVVEKVEEMPIDELSETPAVVCDNTTVDETLPYADADEKTEETPTDQVGETPAANDEVEKVEKTPLDEVGESPAAHNTDEMAEEAPLEIVDETPAFTSDDTTVDLMLPNAQKREESPIDNNVVETSVPLDVSDFNEAAPETMAAEKIPVDDALDDDVGSTAVTADEKDAAAEEEEISPILPAPTDELESHAATMTTDEESSPETKSEEPPVRPVPADEQDMTAAPVITEESSSEIKAEETPTEETPDILTTNSIVAEAMPASDVKVEETFSSETNTELKDTIEKAPALVEAKAEEVYEAHVQPVQTKAAVSEKPPKHVERPTEAEKEKPPKKDALSDAVSTTSAVFSLEELKAGVEGIAANTREQHLHPDEFEKVFGMTKEKFNEMRSWKRIDLKKKVGLF